MGLVNQYRADFDRLRAVSGSRRENALREASKDLIKRWGRTVRVSVKTKAITSAMHAAQREA